MSFGFSPSDLVALTKQCKSTYDSCRNAPEDFKEAGRGAKSLHLVFESLHNEIQNPVSLLNRDNQHKLHIGEIADNCKAVLGKLDNIVLKYSSLGTSKIKTWDRFKFPRKEILDIQGKLQYHQNNLTAYLQMIGVCAMGRVEQRFDVPGKLHEDIMENQERIFGAIDRLAAEVRRGLHTETVFSNHTVDEEEVWKIFRKKLIQQGFSSRYIQPHEKESRKKVKELIDLRLCDSDASNDTSDDTELDISTEPSHTMKKEFQSVSVVTDVESGCESEATLPYRPSKIDLRRRASSSTIKGKKTDSAISLQRSQLSSSRLSLKIDDQDNDILEGTSLKKLDGNLNASSSSSKQDVRTPKTSSGSSQPPMRVWTGKDSRLKLKAAFIHKENHYVHLREEDGGETIILSSNLSQCDVDYLDELDTNRRTSTMKPSIFITTSATVDPRRQSLPGITRITSKPELAIDDTEVHLISRENPETLTGKRTHWRSPWKYRRSKIIMSKRIGKNSWELPAAAARGAYSECERLLAQGHDVDSDKEKHTTTDSEGRQTTTIVTSTTALYRAATNGHFSVTRLLLERGAYVEAKSGDKTILFVITEKRKLEIARLLLEYDARPSRPAGLLRRTPLHVSAQGGDVNMTELLLEFDASIDARDRSKETPLYLAAMEGRKNTVKALLRQGADSSILAADEQTALYKAAGRGHEDSVRELLNYGADPNRGRGLSGETILFKASKKGYVEIVHHLLRYGADPNLANEEKSTSTGSTVDSLIWLLKPDQDPRNVFGLCPLYAAAEGGHEDIVTMLVDHGAEVDHMQNKSAETAMYAAARRKHKSIAEFLSKRGAQIKPQEMVDDVMRILNPANNDLSLEALEKAGKQSSRLEVISTLMGRLTTQRMQRGVNSWTRTELGSGMDFVTESAKILAEAQIKKLITGAKGGIKSS